MKENQKKILRRFRMIGIAEGISFLVLLFIAMPLKYMMNIPEAVKYTGWAHGILFVAFIYGAIEVMGSLKRNFFWLAKAMLASVLPFGTFVLDKQLKKEEALLPG